MAQISVDLLENEGERLDGEQFQSLLLHLIRQSNDPLFGLKSSAYVQPGSYSVLGYIAMSSASLQEAIDQIIPYEKLVGDMGTTSISFENDCMLLTWNCIYTHPIVRQHMIDNVLASWCNYAKWMANIELGPMEIRLQRTMPEKTEVSAYKQAFGCEVSFECDENSVVIPKAFLKTPLRQPDQFLNKTLEIHAANQIAMLLENTSSLTIKVKNIIKSQLFQGAPRKEWVAECLAMNVRTLHRKLNSESTTYSMLLDEVRLELAKNYLLTENLELTEIANKLGFSESASFHRSFKQWTKMTPGEYKKKYQPV